MNKLPVPLASHMEQLVSDFGLLEVFYALVACMKKYPQCKHLINAMEQIQNRIADIGSETKLLEAGSPE